MMTTAIATAVVSAIVLAVCALALWAVLGDFVRSCSLQCMSGSARIFVFE